jgi:rare lipoprotein A
MKLINKYKFFFKILTILFLTSCSETTFLINSAKKISKWDEDPMYKVGNPYKINGKWYYPAIDYNYNEVGIASWYGPGFHGKKTANGEVFDQNKISAAHKTLPMPSIVKVTNLDNGKVLENIRVNDRGPFAGNRIIDLSKKAAQELGFVNSGVAKVRVEIMENESRIYASKNSKKNSVRKANKAKIEKVQRKVIPSEEDEQNSDEFSKDSTEDNSILKDKPVIIQVGAFGDHRNAKSLTEKLSEFKAYIERKFIDNKYLYRVRIGPLSNLDLAKSIKSKLFELGHTSSHLVVN